MRVIDFRKKILKAIENDEYEDCIKLFKSLEDRRDLTPEELVQKSRCIQLSEGSASLEEAEQALRRAIDLDEDYLPALLDLGWFYHAVMDDSRRALSYFQRAAEISREALREAQKGERECKDELAS